MSRWFADTSVAVPAVLASHEAHRATNEAIGERLVELPTHAALETYSVLTRLPADARLAPGDAAVLLAERFGRAVMLPQRVQANVLGELAGRGVAGGAVYDALIAITTRTAGATLLTRDRRAAATYARLDLDVEMID